MGFCLVFAVSWHGCPGGSTGSCRPLSCSGGVVQVGAGGACARARIRLRALSRSALEGCPAFRRMKSVLAWWIARPGRLMMLKRMAFRRLLRHFSSSASRFMAVLRLCASTVMAHQAAFTPNLFEGSWPPARSSFSTECACSLLPQRCRFHQMISSPAVSRLFVTSPLFYASQRQARMLPGTAVVAAFHQQPNPVVVVA